ncbi:ABC transporter permease [Siminovitchia sediminis]|uniref:ABC transporter permease n=1 Tax=Siminovitchia sediminis TaxID=1274353 RepID=A0ABW4KNF1_9BACI
MENMQVLLQYLEGNWANILLLTYDHILMVIVGMILALTVGIPLGIVCAKNDRLASIILAIANTIQVFPSLALLAILMLFLGLGFNTVVIGLFLYSLLPIIRNTYIGLKGVDPSINQAGVGVGMTPFQLLIKVQLPLALPFLLAGVRIATVIGIGVAALAPFVGGEGLGRLIYSGINLRDPMKIYSGSLVAASLAIFVDYLLGKAQKKLEYR